MNFIDAMEIIITMAEDVALDETDPEVSGNPTLLEAARAQKEALTKVRTFHNSAIQTYRPTANSGGESYDKDPKVRRPSH